MEKPNLYIDDRPGIVKAYYETNDEFLRLLGFLGKGLFYVLALTTVLGIITNAFADHPPKKSVAQVQPSKQAVKANKPVKKTNQQKTNPKEVSP